MACACKWQPDRELLRRQIHLRDLLGDLPRLGARQVRKCHHSQLIVDIAVDRRLKSLPCPVVVNRAVPAPDYQPPDPQEIADAVLRLVESGPGERPMRMVVGPVFTEGVADYNRTYEDVRARLEQSLRRPDQAITWGR